MGYSGVQQPVFGMAGFCCTVTEASSRESPSVGLLRAFPFEFRISRCSDLDFAVSIRNSGNSGNTGGGFYELLCGAPIGPGFLFGRHC